MARWVAYTPTAECSRLTAAEGEQLQVQECLKLSCCTANEVADLMIDCDLLYTQCEPEHQ